MNAQEIKEIAKDAEKSFKYARDILKAPFPLGEKVISENETIHKQYKKLFPPKPKPAFFKY